MVRVQFRSAQRSIQCASLCQIQMFYLLKGSNPVLCASLHQFCCSTFSKDQIQYPVLLCTNSSVLSSQRIKSNIMRFFASIQKCSKIKSNVLHCTKFKCFIFSRDQIQYYVPLCTNSVVLPFQRIKSRIMCFFAPTQNVLSSQRIKSNIMRFFAPSLL